MQRVNHNEYIFREKEIEKKASNKIADCIKKLGKVLGLPRFSKSLSKDKN